MALFASRAGVARPSCHAIEGIAPLFQEEGMYR